MTDSFVNELILATANPRRGFVGYKKTKGSELALRKFQRVLIDSNRIVISDSLLEHSLMASLVAPPDLLQAMAIARPPFDNMFIEWNEVKRVGMINQIYSNMGWNERPDVSEIPARVGYHIGVAKHNTVWNLFMQKGNGRILIPSKALMSPNGGDFIQAEEGIVIDGDHTPPFKINNAGETETLNKLRAWQREWGGGWFLGRFYWESHKGKHLKHLEKMAERFIMIGHALREVFYPELGDRITPEEAEQNLLIHHGDARFLIAVLALLNFPHLVEHKVVRSDGARKSLWGRNVPQNEVRVVEIDLPKRRGVKRYARIFRGQGEAQKKRQHIRRGHWRHTRKADGTVHRQWIGQMVVGDPSLGKVEKVYELTGKK